MGAKPDKLVPINMRVCLACVESFMRKGGELNIINKIPGDYICDYCLDRAFVTLQANPRICIDCSKKLGRFHTRKKEDTQELEHKIAKQKEMIKNGNT